MFLKNTAWKGEERKLIQTLVGVERKLYFF